ncbi:hypothetical protein [Archaeoglobus sp.]|jgi:hypothetical protein|uniref:Uncharacterized protein AF_1584 n=2 Tax=Archaeoglobus fulgidus TaxID=2234 RepID=Y1584_ARCFU|nr:hypothetical protein [Archaeoglobus sp.]O28688.1 RecName: Full=Uncharacterized protein AF_1584 [Archaeoglobus fulgidus DSM 4304]AAB89667.1 predicted coding region AF_1584 [Archaeoglobus fulgidus DSM 4304]MDI3497156.1 hypothetical protein [Archaeoglobus sp.]
MVRRGAMVLLTMLILYAAPSFALYGLADFMSFVYVGAIMIVAFGVYIILGRSKKPGFKEMLAVMLISALTAIFLAYFFSGSEVIVPKLKSLGLFAVVAAMLLALARVFRLEAEADFSLRFFLKWILVVAITFTILSVFMLFLRGVV